MMKESRAHRNDMRKPRVWNADSFSQISTCRYDDIIDDKGGILRWLELLHEEGICLIKNSGTDEGAVVSNLKKYRHQESID